MIKPISCTEKPMTREEYENNRQGAELEYSDYLKTHCPSCPDCGDCPHANNFRRLPKYVGGLGMCFNLKTERV